MQFVNLDVKYEVYADMYNSSKSLSYPDNKTFINKVSHCNATSNFKLKVNSHVLLLHERRTLIFILLEPALLFQLCEKIKRNKEFLISTGRVILL